MEHKRIKIRAGVVDGKTNLYLYADQLAFFGSFDEEEKDQQSLKEFSLRWGIYNAIDEKCEEDPTCNLVWDHETEEAYFKFDTEGPVGQHLKEMDLL